MNDRKKNLPSLRNIEWRTIKMKTEKINQVLTYIPTKNLTEFNELIYTGAKLASEKIGVPLKSTKKIKTWKGNSIGNVDKKAMKTDKNDKQRQNAETR